MLEDWKKPHEIRKLILKVGLNPEFMFRIEHKPTIETWFYAMLRKSVTIFHPDVTNYDSHFDFIEINEAKEKLLQLPFFMILNAVNPFNIRKKRLKVQDLNLGRTRKEKELLTHFALGKHQSYVRILNKNQAFPVSNIDISDGAESIFSISNFLQFFESQLFTINEPEIHKEVEVIVNEIKDGKYSNLKDEKIFKRIAFLYQKYPTELSTWINGNQPIYFEATRGVLAVNELCEYQINTLKRLIEFDHLSDTWSSNIIIGSLSWPSLIHRLQKLENREVETLSNTKYPTSSFRCLGLATAVDLDLYEILDPELKVGNYIVVCCPESDTLFFPAKIAGKPRSINQFYEGN